MKMLTFWNLLALMLVACAPSASVRTPPQSNETSNDQTKEVTNLKVTIVVTGSVARSLHGLAPATDESRELLQAAENLGVTLEPLHPGVDDPTLLPFFTADVPNIEKAERVIARLLQVRAVEGAYTKPPDEPP